MLLCLRFKVLRLDMQINDVNRTKILMVLYYYHPYVSGVSVCAKRIAEGLAKSGYQVTVLTSRFDKNLAKTELINGVKVIRRPVILRLNKGVIMPTFWIDIIRYALKNDYVNPHLPMTDSGLSCLFISRSKMVTTYQCDIYLGPTALDKLITFVSMWLMRLQLVRSRVVVPSTLDYLEHSKMKRFIGKAKPINPPVTFSEFYPTDPKPLFDSLSIKDDDIRVGFLGRLVYEKGINYLLDTIPYLKKGLPSFRIIIAGDYENVAGGSVKEELDKYLEQYPGTILFTGHLNEEDRNRFYSGLDVFVLPSIDPLEAFGMVQIEAMLCGTPIVASNLPGVREIVNRSGYGKISKPRNPEDIAEQIIEVVKHPQKYKPQRKKVVNLFNPQDSIDAYAAIMPKK